MPIYPATAGSISPRVLPGALLWNAEKPVANGKSAYAVVTNATGKSGGDISILTQFSATPGAFQIQAQENSDDGRLGDAGYTDIPGATATVIDTTSSGFVCRIDIAKGAYHGPCIRLRMVTPTANGVFVTSYLTVQGS